MRKWQYRDIHFVHRLATFSCCYYIFCYVLLLFHCNKLRSWAKYNMLTLTIRIPCLHSVVCVCVRRITCCPKRLFTQKTYLFSFYVFTLTALESIAGKRERDTCITYIYPKVSAVRSRTIALVSILIRWQNICLSCVLQLGHTKIRKDTNAKRRRELYNQPRYG